jgi:hypothetical protein
MRILALSLEQSALLMRLRMRILALPLEQNAPLTKAKMKTLVQQFAAREPEWEHQRTN